MLAVVWSALTSRLAGVFGAFICVVMLVALAAMRLELNHAHADLKAQVAESKRIAAALSACRTNVATLDKAITDQNAAVAAFRAESAQRSEAAAKAVTEARKATVAANQRIGALMAAKSGADQCKSAEDLIGSMVR